MATSLAWAIRSDMSSDLVRLAAPGSKDHSAYVPYKDVKTSKLAYPEGRPAEEHGEPPSLSGPRCANAHNASNLILDPLVIRCGYDGFLRIYRM